MEKKLNSEENISYRPAQIDDISQLVDLMNSQYAIRRDREYFMWQYFNCPDPTVLICAIWKQKDVVGMFGLRKRNIGPVNMAQAIDMLVTAPWRGCGVFPKLVEKAVACFVDLHALFSLPNLNGKNALVKGPAWRNLLKINSYILNLSKVQVCSSQSSYPVSGNSGKSFYKFGYDEKYRSWRYEKSSIYKYEYVNISEEVFAVTKIFTDPVENVLYGDIVEFNCDLANLNVLSYLIDAVCEKYRKKGINRLTTWALPNTPLKGLLFDYGFREKAHERYFIIKVLDKRYLDLYDISKWHLVQADCEIY